PGAFPSHPRWQRFLIAIAGPAFNVALTIAVLTGVFMVHHETPVYFDKPAIVGWALDDSAAQKAGFIPGDRIVRIQDVQNPTWESVLEKTLLSANQPLQMDVQRGTEILHKTVTPKAGRDQMGEMGWIPKAPGVVGRVAPGLPASRVGIKPGDKVVAINGDENALALGGLLQVNKQNP